MIRLDKNRSLILKKLKNENYLVYSFLRRIIAIGENFENYRFKVKISSFFRQNFVEIDIFSRSKRFLRRYLVNFPLRRENVSKIYFYQFQEKIAEDIENFLFIDSLIKP